MFWLFLSLIFSELSLHVVLINVDIQHLKTSEMSIVSLKALNIVYF